MNAFIFPGQGCQKEGMGKIYTLFLPKQRKYLRERMTILDVKLQM